MFEEKASAKVNLCLQIVGQKSNGFHLLDSIVGFTEFGDHLSFKKSDELELTMKGAFSDQLPVDKSNLIFKAAELLRTINNIKTGAHITLTKNLPPSAGLGGGSSDAAAAIRGLSRLWGTDLPDISDLMKIGSDLPVCINQKTQHMKGFGEVLEEINTFPNLPILLVNPLKKVSTQTVFRMLKNKKNPPLSKYEKLFQAKKDWINWLVLQRNDLMEPAVKVEPVISEVLRLISKQISVEKVSMSGSGATCFGIFENKHDCDLAMQRVRLERPDWWSVSTEIISI
jgi:4-diphosphocytidyl-2-C-methyl-D-erythritol kinase